MPVTPLQPTLWRTCRVLANATRLRLFAQLVRKHPQSVSQLAEQCTLTLPVASQSLRALEARSLLRVARVRRRVEYRVPTRSEAGALADLVAALQTALHRDPLPTARVVKLATAFTHPSRIKIYRSLQTGPRSLAQIRTATLLSSPALSRHLNKLLARGFIGFVEGMGKYGLLKHSDPIGQALSEQALSP